MVQYAKTLPVFDEYKAAKYSKRFLAQHEAGLADCRAAKAALNDLLDGAKLPKMAKLKEKRRKLAAEKKALYDSELSRMSICFWQELSPLG